jgi:putative flippase GtrA
VVSAVANARARLQPVLHEVAKFGVVGAICFIVDVGLFDVLHFTADVGPLTAKACSTVVAATLAYAGNRAWSFRHRARTGVRREFSVFFLLNAIGLVITEVFIGFTHYLVDATGFLATNAALVVGTAAATVFRFWAYKRWVFLHPDAFRGATPVETLDDELEAVVQI